MTHEHEGHALGHEHGSSLESHAGHEHHMSMPSGPSSESLHAHHSEKDFSTRFWICLALTLPILILSPAIQEFLKVAGKMSFPGDSIALLALSSAVYFYGGWPFFKGFVDEMRKKIPGMMTLVAVAVTVSYVYSVAVTLGLKGMVFYWELATLIDIMLLGHWIEMRFITGASKALSELVMLVPSHVHLQMPDGNLMDAPVEQLRKGSLFVVKPGERFPTDGKIREGRTTVDESMLTGESRPVQKNVGDDAIGGSINGDFAVTVEATKLGQETFLSQMIETVRRAQESKSYTQDLADRAAKWLTIIALSVGVVTLVSWLLAKGGYAYAIERAVTVMVITCPHALGLAVPLVVAMSTSFAAANGLLIRNRSAFERARNINLVIFDKTGTLTVGEFKVQAIIPFSGQAEDEILKLAASVEKESEHPIAAGIVRDSVGKRLALDEVTGFRAIKGKGASGMVGGQNVVVAGPSYLDEHSIIIDEALVKPQLAQGRTVVFVIVDDKPVGAIAVGDKIREESRAAIDSLKRMGIRTAMLTGDNRTVAQAVAKSLGIDEFEAEVLPDRKAGQVKKFMDQGYRVAMAGDGINDTPALATADLGIAIGAGTDVAIETADVVLVRSDPRDIVTIVKLAKATYSKMAQNLVWATGYNLAAIPLAAGVFAWAGFTLSPAAGAALMSISTVVVAINAKLLRVS